MFIVCEPFFTGMQHVPFNSSLLKTISLAFPNEKVYYYAEQNHIGFVRRQIGTKYEAFISWRSIAVPEMQSKFYNRLRQDFRNVKFMLDNLEDDSKKNVLVIVGNPSILWALKYYLRNTHQNKKVQVVLHGNFSTLDRIPRKEILNPLYYIGSLKTALKLPGYKKLQHIVLEESIKNKILEKMPFLRDSFVVLEHPIPVDRDKEDYDYVIPKLKFPIQFGFLGLANENKGFTKYLEVANEISTQYPDKTNFHIIGRLHKRYKQKKIFKKVSFLSGKIDRSRLSRTDYLNRLKGLHFVCLFFSNHYEYSASGVLMDCIEWGKPIVGTKISVLKTMQQSYGDIGYLCDINECSRTIKNIIERKDSDRYDSQVFTMRNIKASRTPETLSKKYYRFVMALDNSLNFE